MPVAAGAAPKSSVYHCAAEIHRHVALAAGVGRTAGGDGAARRERRHERLGRQAVQVPHHAVVRQHLRLVVGERHGQEPFVFAPAASAASA